MQFYSININNTFNGITTLLQNILNSYQELCPKLHPIHYAVILCTMNSTI